MTFRNVLAFQNFILMMAVIFGLQFVDRSFGPVLPLYVEQLGIAPARVPLVSGVLFSITAGAGALGHHFCGALLQRRHQPRRDRRRRRGRGGRRGLLRRSAHDVRWLFAGDAALRPRDRRRR